MRTSLLTVLLLLASVLLLASSCADPAKGDVDTDVVETDADDTVVDTDADTGVVDDTDAPPIDTDTESDGPVPTSCKEAGGICTNATLCGTRPVLTAFADDCLFDDGPGVCCEPPAAKPTGDTCLARGGVCAPIAGCDFVDGWFWDEEACWRRGGPGFVCCLPEVTCGPATSECCNADHSTSFRSMCDHGVESCAHVAGTTLVPIGSCLTP